MHTHARVEQQRRVKFCSEINRAGFLCRQHQRLLPGDAPSPARVALGTANLAANPGQVQGWPGTTSTGLTPSRQLWISQQPLLRITNYAIITHFLNSFATAHRYLQPTATCSHRPADAGVSRTRPFPKYGTDRVPEHGSHVPTQWDPALPAASTPVLVGPGMCP